MESIRILGDGMTNFRRFLVNGIEANTKQIAMFLERSLMLVTALSPVIGYDEASRVAIYAHTNDLTLRDAALGLGAVSAEEFDRLVDPRAMVHPSVQGADAKRSKSSASRPKTASRPTPPRQAGKRS
jgi:fumarate hydratase class II